MPTNLIRPLPTGAGTQSGKKNARKTQGRQLLTLEAPGVRLQLNLLDTATAARIAGAVPVFGFAEPWGACVHFKLPIASGRERGARINGQLGEVYYWMGEDRILIPFGPTPISRPNEIRLPEPSNPWATIVGDPKVLQRVAPGAKITLKA